MVHSSDVLPLITGQGGALIVLFIWNLYLHRQITWWRRGFMAQMQRADSAEEAARAILAHEQSRDRTT